MGNFVAYLENENAEHYHLGKIAALGDNVVIDTYATTSPNLRAARWKPLECVVKTEQYTITKSAKRNQVQVQDELTATDASDLILANNLTLLHTQRIANDSRAKLKNLKQKHHRLGKTFP